MKIYPLLLESTFVINSEKKTVATLTENNYRHFAYLIIFTNNQDINQYPKQSPTAFAKTSLISIQREVNFRLSKISCVISINDPSASPEQRTLPTLNGCVLNKAIKIPNGNVIKIFK